MFQKILRWIAIVPAVLGIYLISKMLNTSGFEQVNPEVVDNIRISGGLGGDYIMGGALLFHREAIAIAVSFLGGSYIAPNYRKTTYGILALALMAFVVFELFTAIQLGIQEESGLVIAIETVGQIVGVIIGGLFIWYNELDKKNNT
jgi:hypothetical protein